MVSRASCIVSNSIKNDTELFTGFDTRFIAVGNILSCDKRASKSSDEEWLSQPFKKTYEIFIIEYNNTMAHDNQYGT